MHINPSHPRAASLRIRERLVWGVKKGFTHPAGLLAHGRGEAFDYLLGEKTQQFAKEAITAASACLLLAKYPILSINGNAAALVAKEFAKLAKLLDCYIEVNLFHQSKKRAYLIESYLKKFAKNRVLISIHQQQIIVPNIASSRKMMLKEGIGKADVVFVPLEDGDRTQALILLGKKVITIDLNPLSRTAQTSTITIVDNITRAIPLLIKTIDILQKMPKSKLLGIINNFDNKKNLHLAIQYFQSHLSAAKML